MWRSGVLAGFLALAAPTASLDAATVPGRQAPAASAPVSEHGSASPVVLAVLSALADVGQKPLWPGFELRRIPVAIFDGQQTYLYRHPAPAPEFTPVPGRGDLWVSPGQHAVVRANTSVEIGGVLTATCLAGAGASPAALAAIVAHEAFHVYQRQKHTDWVTNEMNLFTYPSDDVANLAEARLEAAAFERAVASDDSTQARCWAAEAIRLRLERFQKLSADATSYERGVELVEGTASLVQYRTGDRSQPIMSALGFPADGARRRAYATGRTMGLLLDRLAPGWETRLEQAKAPVLDRELAGALAKAPGGCTAAPPEVERARVAAATDVAAFVARRDGAARDFAVAPGWRIVVRAAEGAPFKPMAFDPMNVVNVGGGAVLHTRWLKAGRNGGFVEALDRKAMTRAAGAHPLFSGFREVEVTGLPEEPEVTSRGEAVSLRGDGVQADFPHATLIRADRTITIVVAGS